MQQPVQQAATLAAFQATFLWMEAPVCVDLTEEEEDANADA